MTLDIAKLRELAEAAKANMPVWCGRADGTWTRERSRTNFDFVVAASPSTLIALLDQLAAMTGARDRACSMLDDAVQLRDDADEWFSRIGELRKVGGP